MKRFITEFDFSPKFAIEEPLACGFLMAAFFGDRPVTLLEWFDDAPFPWALVRKKLQDLKALHGDENLDLPETCSYMEIDLGRQNGEIAVLEVGFGMDPIAPETWQATSERVLIEALMKFLDGRS